ncbi:MAG: ATP-binding protein [Rhizobacter sp.]
MHASTHSPPAADPHRHAFLSGGGQMGALMRAHDWAATPLGPPDAWPQSLRSVLSVCLNSPVLGTVLWGPELRMLYNDAYIPSMADRHPAALGRPVAEVWDSAWERVAPAFMQAMVTGEGFSQRNVELPMQRRGRQEVTWWDFSASPIRGESGEIVGLFNQGVEITEAVLAERRAAEEAARQRLIFQQMPGFVGLMKGPEHVYEYVNDAFVHIAGDRALLGERFKDAFPELADQGFHALVDDVYRKGESFSAQGLPIRLAGESEDRYVDLLYQPVRDEHGAVTGIFTGGYDITERVRLERRRDALATLTDRLAGAGQAGYEGARVVGLNLQASRAGYGTVQHDTGELQVVRDWVADGVESLAGITPLAAYGRHIHALRRGEATVVHDVRIDPGMPDAESAAALEALHARSFVNVPVLEGGRLVAVLFVHDERARHWTAEELAFMHEAASRTRTAVERATAEAELRSNEERYRLLSAELAEASRMKDEFLATLAHELRNPLAPVRNALALQRLRGDEPAVIAQTRALMERQLLHMVRLIDDLLDLSRLSRGTVALQTERVSMASAIGLAIDASRPFIEQAAHELSLSLPGEDLVVLADPVRLAQVITNLLNNAGKFTPGGGRLAVSLEREGACALMRVTDNGIGLRADQLERIFNMFEQVDRSHAQVSGGLGIGLTLVRRLVEAQGGTVSARSDGLGTGSTFLVRLPLAAPLPASQPAAGSEARAAAGRSQALRVLIADDNEDAAQSLAMLMEIAGHETRVVADGASAVAAAREFLPHAAILDIAMPILDGLAAARSIRVDAAGADVFLIALSGFGQAADRQRSAEAGFDAHLVKPVDHGDVERLLEAHLRHGRRVHPSADSAP